MKRSLGAAVVAAALLAGAPCEALAETHKDEKLGYQINFPSKWMSMPLDTRDSWIQAQFVSNSSYYYEGNKGQSWGNHTPHMDVVVIPLGEAAGSGATVEKTDTGVRIREDLPYKDFKEYLDKTSRNLGGFHFSSEEEGTLNGMKVIRYELTVDKLVTVPLKVHGWAFYTEDAIYGVLAEILEKEEKKLKPEIFQAFSSLKTFPRKGALPHTGRTGQEIEITDGTKKKDEDLTPEELEKRRRDAVDQALQQMKDTLPRGWTVVEGKNFIAVTHADQKYTRNLLQHAEAMRDWLEKNLGFCGSGYTGRVILRICADDTEYSALQNSRGWWRDVPEIITYQDKTGWSDWAMESLNRGLFQQWMRDKNRDLAWGAPNWIQNGLSDFIEGGRSKGGRIEFRADDWDRDQMRVLARENKLLGARSFFAMTSDELWGDAANWRQTGFFVKFLLTGAASRHGKFKGVFESYVKNLIIHLAEAREAEEAAAGAERKEPQNAEEEEAMVRARQQSWRKNEKAMLDRLIERTFGDWTAKDWEAFDFLYRKDAK